MGKSSPVKFAKLKLGGIFPIEQADTPGIPITWEEFAQAHVAVEEALKFFNYAPLVKRLSDAESLLRLERSIAADIISGKLKRPKHRRARPEMVRSRQFYLAWCVLAELEADLVGQRTRKGEGAILKPNLKAAVAKVAGDKANRAKKSAVYQAVKAHPEIFVGHRSK